MTPAELVEILYKHEDWLKGKRGGARANLALQEMCGLSLPGIQLAQAKLTGADLSNCNFSGANLSKADLFGANLLDSDFQNAVLNSADLRGAILRGCNLNWAVTSPASASGRNSLCAAS